MDKGQFILILLIILVILAAVAMTNGVTPEYPYSPALHPASNSIIP